MTNNIGVVTLGTLYRSREYVLYRVVRNVFSRMPDFSYTERDVDQWVSNLAHVWSMDAKELPSGVLFEYRKEIGNRVEEFVKDRIVMELGYDVFGNHVQDQSHRFDFVEVTSEGVVNFCDVKSTMGSYGDSVYVFEIRKETLDKYRKISIGSSREFYLYVYMIRKNGVYKVNIRDLVLVGEYYVYNFVSDVPLFTLGIEEYYDFLKFYGDYAYKLVDVLSYESEREVSESYDVL